MATQILAVGDTAADSADVIVGSGTPLTVALNDAGGPAVVSDARVYISLKDPTGEYFRVDELSAGRRSLVIVGAGTYRFTRVAGVSCGVFSG